jgi:hypothetical protein
MLTVNISLAKNNNWRIDALWLRGVRGLAVIIPRRARRRRRQAREGSDWRKRNPVSVAVQDEFVIAGSQR